jgi:hypothetical protein
MYHRWLNHRIFLTRMEQLTVTMTVLGTADEPSAVVDTLSARCKSMPSRRVLNHTSNSPFSSSPVHTYHHIRPVPSTPTQSSFFK